MRAALSAELANAPICASLKSGVPRAVSIVVIEGRYTIGAATDTINSQKL